MDILRIIGAKQLTDGCPAMQYNWGYPAALKNALDYLYRSWNGKPAMIVSYGSHGGGKGAAQLKEVCALLVSFQVMLQPVSR